MKMKMHYTPSSFHNQSFTPKLDMFSKSKNTQSRYFTSQNRNIIQKLENKIMKCNKNIAFPVILIRSQLLKKKKPLSKFGWVVELRTFVATRYALN